MRNLLCPYRRRNLTERMGDELYYRSISSWRRRLWVICVAAVPSEISAYATIYLAIPTIPSSHRRLFLGIHGILRSPRFQLYAHVAIGVWQERHRGFLTQFCWPTNLIGCNMEYPAMVDWVVNEFCRVIHPSSNLRHHPPHPCASMHPRRGNPSSLKHPDNHLLGHDIPISPINDHRCRILVPSLFPLRSRIRAEKASLRRGRSLHLPHVPRLRPRCSSK